MEALTSPMRKKAILVFYAFITFFSCLALLSDYGFKFQKRDTTDTPICFSLKKVNFKFYEFFYNFKSNIKKNLTLVSNKFDRAVIDTDLLSLLVVTSDKASLKIKKRAICVVLYMLNFTTYSTINVNTCLHCGCWGWQHC